ncbi:MAG TPA: hypothetical protein VGH40_20620 [Roseiarcus sp.]|jgi:hypothetical protein
MAFFWLFISPPRDGDFPEGRRYARLIKVDRIGSGAQARSSFEFDTVESGNPDDIAEWIRSGEAREQGRFGLLKIVTTEKRFREVIGALPEVGRWYELDVAREPETGGLMSWFARLEDNGYTSLARGYTRDGEPLAAPDDDDLSPRPRSVGAAATPVRQLPSAIVIACRPLSRPNAKQLAAMDVLKNIPPSVQVRVRDVGQANFVTLEDRQHMPLLHFDVGTPIAFNRHTLPITPPPSFFWDKLLPSYCHTGIGTTCMRVCSRASYASATGLFQISQWARARHASLRSLRMRGS